MSAVESSCGARVALSTRRELDDIARLGRLGEVLSDVRLRQASTRAGSKSTFREGQLHPRGAFSELPSSGRRRRRGGGRRGLDDLQLVPLGVGQVDLVVLPERPHVAARQL